MSGQSSGRNQPPATKEPMAGQGYHSKAPERIWISPVETDSDWPVWDTRNQWTDGVEYVRADLCAFMDQPPPIKLDKERG